MKKYIAPNAQIIALNLDGQVLFNGSMIEAYGDEGAEKYSNKRQSASNVIWGFDDEAE